MSKESDRKSKEHEKKAKDFASKTASSSLFNLEDIGSLLEMLSLHEVREFELEKGEEKLSLKRGTPQPEERFQPQFQQVITPGSFGAQSYPTMDAGQRSPSQVSAEIPSESKSAIAESRETREERGLSSSAEITKDVAKEQATGVPAKSSKKLVEVSSPMVGTLYRRPAVDSDPYVQEGDAVKKGDVLCIVEAMKLMNEIESEIAGTIVEICLDDGQMVEYGEVLFRIEPAK